MSEKERIVNWAKSLTAEEAIKLIPELVEELIMTETISFYDTNLCPYWSNSGEPLVEGQVKYTD